MFGLLPSTEVLILWLVEQFLVFMLGGSPAASNIRLVVNFILSVGAFLGCYFIDFCFGSVMLAALTGYLLSCDLGRLGTQLWSACHRNNNSNRVSSVKPSSLAHLSPPHTPNTGFLWSWCWSTTLYHIIMLAATAAAAGATNYYVTSLPANVFTYVGYCIIGLCVAEKVFRDAQSVFVFFGMWRNIFYPANIERTKKFRQVKKRLLVFGILRRIIVTWLSPVLMVVYLSLQVTSVDVMTVSMIDSFSIPLGVLYVFATVRAFRWVWQSTTHALLETSCIHIVAVTLSDNSVVTTLGVPILLLVAGVVRDRLSQLLNKMFFVLALMVVSWTDKKQRRSSTVRIMIMNILFFPVVLAVVVAASALSAPLLCLFTLPLFFIGYPRPSKFWPEPVGSSASTCPDTLYYKQLSGELTKALRYGFANGSLGEPSVGNHYLMRYQDRLLWTMVLERGAGYCTVSIKGLELQETSCHTAEASRVDDQFVEAFVGKGKNQPCCTFNGYPFHCMTPVDAAEVRSYSDARNVLTGVIDCPDSVGMTLSFFIKSLIWVLLRHINKLKKKEELARKMKEKEIALMEKTNSLSSQGEVKAKFYKDNSNKRKDKVSVVNNNTAPKELNHNMAAARNNRAVVVKDKYDRGVVVDRDRHDTSVHQLTGGGDSFALPSIVQNKTNPNSRPGSRGSSSSRQVSLSSSLHSFTDSIWSEDFDAEKNKKKSSIKQQHKVSTVVSITNNSSHKPPSPHAVMTTLPPIKSNKNPIFNNSLSSRDAPEFSEDLDFGLPAVDINVPRTRPDFDFDEPVTGVKSMFANKPTSKFMVSNGNHIYKPLMNLAGSPDFKCQYSTHISVPFKWRELPIEPSQLARYIPQFPTSWYKHTLSTLDWSVTEHPGQKVAAEVGSDDALTNCYSQLVMACYSAFDTPGRPGGASYLYKCYNGDVPWNAMMDWLAEDKELHGLVIKAFRYGFKLMLDQTLIGEISSDQELEASLRDYDDNWYIGKDTEPDWGVSVMENRSNLFSLGVNTGQGMYTSRTLSLQEVLVHIGRVNRESVMGQWANLNLELLYMTNDDEERYSIQAQPALLRNLTVQAADPPLGYPIYSSPPLSIPTV
ncbi:pecanex-like protein 4 isoform X2 [Physella acuta]|nr:pecanex-like protein 4 isoform X2 [Physella acuta]